jgi:hypothetical protein
MGKLTFEQRWKRIQLKGVRDEKTGCLLWSGRRNKAGYAGGFIHRKAYCLHHRLDSIDPKLHIRHGPQCQRHCFEPTHLQLGTAQDNADDRVRDGTTRAGDKHHFTKLSNDTVKCIFESKGIGSQRDRAKRFGVTKNIINGIDIGDSWNSVTGLPKRSFKPPPTRETVVASIISHPAIRERIQTKLNENRLIDGYGCHLWTMGLDATGYGRTTVQGVTFTVHRLSWILTHGQKIPEGQVIRHGQLCNGKLTCFNPDHLTLGTFKENSNDQLRDGTRLMGEVAPYAKITNDMARAIIASDRTIPIKERAKQFNVSKMTIWHIDNNTSWRHLPRNSITSIRSYMKEETAKLIIASKNSKTVAERAILYNVSKPAIWAIDRNLSWKHLPRPL